MKARLVMDLTCPPSAEHPDGKMSAGTLIDHPEAYMLVQGGVAMAVDEECTVRAGLTPEAFERAMQAGLRRERHIHPDDIDAYNAGYMIGYEDDGSWKPGPNYDEWLALQEQDEDDDEGDYE